ncbi:MAG: bifunctional nuclease family protein [Coriobacteriia bacterium]|nr:bifunctional nuclease family protein [Coriobacteriia bacterium]
MIPVRIASLSVDSVSNQPVIILRPVDDEPGHGRLLPIWIGHPEATAILLALQGMEPPRPMTHDLLQDVIVSSGLDVARVEIVRLEEGTFFAELTLEDSARTVVVDARPSDSIALAIRTGSPIFVSEDVLDEAAVDEESAVVGDAEEEIEQFRHFLESVDPSDFQG